MIAVYLSPRKKMPASFNLLVSTTRSGGKWACAELLKILKELGDDEAVVDETAIRGLIFGKTNLDPFEVVHKMRSLLKETPWMFRSVLKVIPIEKVIRTDVGEIVDAVSTLAHKIGADEVFRVTVEKRHTALSTKDIILAVASKIVNEVDLEKPDKIVLVEILGNVTGISILKPEDIFSIVKEKKLI